MQGQFLEYIKQGVYKMPTYKGKKYSYTASGVMNYSGKKIDDLKDPKNPYKAKDKKDQKKLDNLYSLYGSAKFAWSGSKTGRVKLNKTQKDKLSKMEKKGII